MKIQEIITEAQRPGWFRRLGTSLAANLLGKGAAQGKQQAYQLYDRAWQDFERKRGQALLDYHEISPVRVLEMYPRDHALLLRAFQELDLDETSEDGLDKTQLQDLILTWVVMKLSGRGVIKTNSRAFPKQPAAPKQSAAKAPPPPPPAPPAAKAPPAAPNDSGKAPWHRSRGVFE